MFITCGCREQGVRPTTVGSTFWDGPIYDSRKPYENGVHARNDVFICHESWNKLRSVITCPGFVWINRLGSQFQSFPIFWDRGFFRAKMIVQNDHSASCFCLTKWSIILGGRHGTVSNRQNDRSAQRSNYEKFHSPKWSRSNERPWHGGNYRL